MKVNDLITCSIYSDIMGISNGNRLYLKKKYSNKRMNIEDWVKICKEENIELRVK